jgi:hypothetical protein
MHRRPTTLCGVRDSCLLDLPRGCSARAPNGVPTTMRSCLGCGNPA